MVEEEFMPRKFVTGDFLMMTSWMACYCTKPTSRS